MKIKTLQIIYRFFTCKYLQVLKNIHFPAPGKVQNLRVNIPGDSVTSVVVTWASPAVTNGAITGYKLNVSTSTSIVYATTISSHDNQRAVTALSTFSQIVLHSYTHYLIPYIGPYVPYHVSVAALTRKGSGEPEKLTVFTLQGSKIINTLMNISCT